MEGNSTGRRTDLDRTDKLPILTEDNLVKLDRSRTVSGDAEAGKLDSSIAELRETLEQETQRSRKLETRLEAQGEAIARLTAEFGRDTAQNAATRKTAEAAETQNQITRDLISKVQVALRQLNQRISSLETYIAGRPDGWQEMEQALHTKSLRIAEAEAQLAEKIALLTNDLASEHPDSEGQAEPDEFAVPEAPAAPLSEFPATPLPEVAAAPLVDELEPDAEPDNPKPDRVPALVGLSPEAPIACAIDKDAISIGRDPECDISIPADSVSRQHAYLIRDGALTVIEDRSSTNGVFVNTVQTTRQVLADGDEVSIGNCRFRFVSGESRD